MLPNKQAEFVQKVSEGVAEKMQTKSGPEVVINTLANAVRVAHISRTLVLKRHTVFADGAALTTGSKIAHSIGLAVSVSNLLISATELARRVIAGRSLLEVKPVEKLDNDLVTGAAADYTVAVVKVARGNTLFNKRLLSPYGRAYAAFTGSVVAARLGLHLYATTK